VIFDMDGVLTDTERLMREAMELTAAEVGRDLPFSVFQRMVGAPREHNRRVLAEHFGPGFDVDAWTAAVDAKVEPRLQGLAPLKPGVRELIAFLTARGLPLAIATSAGPGAVARQLGGSGLLPSFGAVVTRVDYDRGKPHPDPFVLAAARLGVETGTCLALEDSHNGVRSAAAAGMMTIMVPDMLEPTPEIAALTLSVCPGLPALQAALAERL
jgi:HAD superfamily hydrolase (TIGR01509 family)